jgi:hypothetical protein
LLLGQEEFNVIDLDGHSVQALSDTIGAIYGKR